jgi:hypothetical protein
MHLDLAVPVLHGHSVFFDLFPRSLRPVEGLASNSQNAKPADVIYSVLRAKAFENALSL